MRKVILLLFISSSVWAQQSAQQMAQDFNNILKVEDAEKFYNKLIAGSEGASEAVEKFTAYRAQLAVDWLAKGNFDRYHFYKNTHPKFTALQLFELSNLLEQWVDDNKNVAIVEEVSRQILQELEKKLHDDTFGRLAVLYEVNAVANARLGNMSMAMKNIDQSTALQSPFRQFAYFRNSKANFLNRYSFILSAGGEHQRALDTLSKAIREANSTPKSIVTLKDVYKKVKGGTKGMDEYISSLQQEAYQHIYEEVEAAWLTEPMQAPNIDMVDMNGKRVKLSDFRGKIVMIDFWSTVCKPCVAAFPAFERAVDLYKKEPFQLFVINLGENRDVVKLYMEKKGYKLDVLFDDNEAMFSALNALGTPQKFIIDASGNINQTGIGYAGSDDKEFYKLKAMVELTKARAAASRVYRG